MIPHMYAIDSQNKAQDLASQILSASSPPTITSACTAIEAFLQKRTVDQSRSFFSVAFPSLICKIFGFDDVSSQKSRSPNGWIDQIQASNDSELAARVFNLLSPSGILLSSISLVDRHALVKYVFPVERLPEWVKYMLQNEKDCRNLSDLCPLFKGRVKEDAVKGSYQVQLNVFEYYMFWFAYYPVCKGNGENSETVSVRKSRRFTLENWTSSLPVLGGTIRVVGQKHEPGLYIRLLYAYLHAFVPNCGSEASQQPYRSSLIHYSSGYDGSLLQQAEFLVNTLAHFWLVDNDFSPLSVSICKSSGVSFPFRAVLGETPPTSGLAEVVNIFVKYLNISLVSVQHGFKPVGCSGSPYTKMSGAVDFVSSPMPNISSVVSWNSLIQRPLYRFILRTFLFCPVGSSIKNVSQVFSLWISYMEPWKITVEDFGELDVSTDVGKDATKDSHLPASGYTSSWEGYVLSNYLFFSSLTMHFLGFAHKFLHNDVEAIIQMVLKVLNILTSSKELMELMKKVDAAFHSKMSGSSSMTDNTYKYVPSIREQLQDWEDGLCENDADGSFLHENWNQDLRLLSDSEDGGHQLLQLLILRAESEIQRGSGGCASQSVKDLDSLKSQMSCLFGGNVGMAQPDTSTVQQSQCTRDERFQPRRIGNHNLADIKYKGDWMRRPASNGEVVWLARFLVRLSDWLNEALTLNQGYSSHGTRSSWLYVDVSDKGTRQVDNPKEAIKMLLSSAWSWFVLLTFAVLRFMREHGLRVNLRIFASKKVLVVLFFSAVYSLLKRVFHLDQQTMGNK